MRKSKNNSVLSLSIVIIFIIIFFLPNKILNQHNIPLDLILFIIITLGIIIEKVLRTKYMSINNIVFLSVLLLMSFVQKSLRPFHLLSIISLDILVSEKEIITKTINRFFLLELSLLSTLLYSIIYFGDGNRYIYTAIGEVNQSGYALIVLFILVKEKYTNLGKVLLLIGLLTFSRSYLLGLLIYLIFNKFSEEFIRKVKNKFSFTKLTFFSVFLLIIVSNLYLKKFKLGSITGSDTGFHRFTNIFDYSNFLRFTTNTNLIKFYLMYPKFLIYGLNTMEFFEANKISAIVQNIPYRNIKPHNFFFSYFQIYGVFSFFIFHFISRLFEKILTVNNYPSFLVVFSYLTFLGIGANRYWLFLSVILLLYNRGDEK